MFLDTIPFETDYADRVVIVRGADLPRIKIAENTPEIIGSDTRQKQFYLDLIAALQGHPCSPHGSSLQTLTFRSAHLLRDSDALGAIVQEGQLLFARKTPRGIVGTFCELVRLAGNAGKQLILVGDDSLFAYLEAVRSFKGKAPCDIGWLQSRLSKIGESNLFLRPKLPD